MKLLLRRAKRQSGGVPLETVLFLPVLLLFVFVVTDGGLAYTEKSGVVNALRMGVNAAGLRTKTETLLTIDSDLILGVSENARQVLVEIAQGIEDNVRAIQGYEDGSPGSTYSVTLSLITVAVDPDTGALLGSQVAESVTLPDWINPELPQFNPEFHYRPRETFLDEELNASATVPSPYAVPMGPKYFPTGGSDGMRFNNISAVLYGEVTALTRGVNTSYVHGVLGNFYALQEQQLALLRTQLR